MNENFDDLFDIRIEFERGTGDPTRIFRSMAGLIETMQSVDQHLARVIGSNVSTTLVLEEIEAASLKSRIRTVIVEIPDEAIKAGEIKKLIGHFLFKAKHVILDWCNDRKSISNRGEIKQLEAEILKLASETDIKILPAYAPLDTTTLLSDINSMKQSLSYLESKDKATFSTELGTSEYNKSLSISDDMFKELITKEMIASEGERIIKVKKPDYLGESKWGFKYAGHMVEAKISDMSWLSRFQSNQETVQPGDSLRAVLREEISYGYDSEVVHTDYEVKEVKEVIRGIRVIQGELLDDK
jgi:hypothetical protein